MSIRLMEGRGAGFMGMSLKGFVQKLNNGVVIWALSVMRRTQYLFRRRLKNQLAFNHIYNLGTGPGHMAILDEGDGLIEDQNAYTDMAFGLTTMKAAGCEIFAAYNAMVALGPDGPWNEKGMAAGDTDTGGTRIKAANFKPPALSDMISEFEKDGMLLSGLAGTAPKAIRDYLTGHGYKISFTTREVDFDRLGNDCRALILTMYNDRFDIFKEVHTICITKSGGKFTAHNTYCNGTVVGPYESVTELIAHINGGKAKGISLIGIK